MLFDSEASDGANAGLGIARDMLLPVTKECENVRVADIWALCGAAAIEHCGGPIIRFR
jgi:catalase (peroxidase I)